MRNSKLITGLLATSTTIASAVRLRSQLLGIQPPGPSGGYPHLESLFGPPSRTNETIVASVHYVGSQLCSRNDADLSTWYPPTIHSEETTGELIGPPDKFILTVDRGGCTFVQKVRIAQTLGATAVVIADNACLCDHDDICQSEAGFDCERFPPIMADDGSGSDIDIHSFLMFKQDADTLKDQLRGGDEVVMEISWKPYLPKTFDLWVSPFDAASQQFLLDFKPYARSFGEANITVEPRLYISDVNNACLGTDSESQCYTLCTNNGRYCSSDPDGDIDSGLSGAEAVAESLRWICIRKVHSLALWWEYITAFIEQCSSADVVKDKTCIKSSMESASIDIVSVGQCMEDSGGLYGNLTNELLEGELIAGEQAGVDTLPSLFVDGKRIELSEVEPIEAICVEFLHTNCHVLGTYGYGWSDQTITPPTTAPEVGPTALPQISSTTVGTVSSTTVPTEELVAPGEEAVLNTTSLPGQYETNSTPISQAKGPNAIANDPGNQADSNTAATEMSDFQICNAPEDCALRVRSRSPENGTTSVGLCSCYSSSLLVSFDECEGETDETCAVAKCPEACEGFDVYCSGEGRCTLESLDGSSSVAPRLGILSFMSLLFAGISLFA